MGRLRRLRGEAAEQVRRRRLTASVRNATLPPPPSAFARFGTGSVIVPPARIDNPAAIEIGDRAIVHELCWLIARPARPGGTARLVIGDGAMFNRFVKVVCTSEVVFGENVVLGDHCLVTDTHFVNVGERGDAIARELAEPRPIRIGSNTLLGFGVTVLPGVSIGEGCSVGAGATVETDIPDHCVAVGAPARVVRRLDPTTGRWEQVRPGD